MRPPSLLLPAVNSVETSAAARAPLLSPSTPSAFKTKRKRNAGCCDARLARCWCPVFLDLFLEAYRSRTLAIAASVGFLLQLLTAILGITITSCQTALASIPEEWPYVLVTSAEVDQVSDAASVFRWIFPFATLLAASRWHQPLWVIPSLFVAVTHFGLATYTDARFCWRLLPYGSRTISVTDPSNPNNPPSIGGSVVTAALMAVTRLFEWGCIAVCVVMLMMVLWKSVLAPSWRAGRCQTRASELSVAVDDGEEGSRKGLLKAGSAATAEAESIGTGKRFIPILVSSFAEMQGLEADALMPQRHRQQQQQQQQRGPSGWSDVVRWLGAFVGLIPLRHLLAVWTCFMAFLTLQIWVSSLLGDAGRALQSAANAAKNSNSSFAQAFAVAEDALGTLLVAAVGSQWVVFLAGLVAMTVGLILTAKDSVKLLAFYRLKERYYPESDHQEQTEAGNNEVGTVANLAAAAAPPATPPLARFLLLGACCRRCCGKAIVWSGMGGGSIRVHGLSSSMKPSLSSAATAGSPVVAAAMMGKTGAEEAGAAATAPLLQVLQYQQQQRHHHTDKQPWPGFAPPLARIKAENSPWLLPAAFARAPEAHVDGGGDDDAAASDLNSREVLDLAAFSFIDAFGYILNYSTGLIFVSTVLGVVIAALLFVLTFAPLRPWLASYLGTLLLSFGYRYGIKWCFKRCVAKDDAALDSDSDGDSDSDRGSGTEGREGVKQATAIDKAQRRRKRPANVGSGRIMMPRLFAFLDLGLSFTSSILIGTTQALTRVILSVVWSIMATTQLAKPVLPSAISMLDSGYAAYGAMHKVRIVAALAAAPPLPKDHRKRTTASVAGSFAPSPGILIAAAEDPVTRGGDGGGDEGYEGEDAASPLSPSLFTKRLSMA